MSLCSFASEIKNQSTMKIIKPLFIILFVILPLISFATSDGDDIIEIILQSQVPSGSIRRLPQHCPLTCLYYISNNTLHVSAEDGDFSGTQIYVTNLTTNEIEYSVIVSSYSLDEIVSLSESELYHIEITLPSGRAFYGNLSTEATLY